MTKKSANSTEKIFLRSGAANHLVNIESVGGILYLLPSELVFEAHIFNIQKHVFRVNLNQIKEVKTFNSMWIIPNGLEIITLDGQSERFIVNRRSVWKSEIEQQKKVLVNYS